MKTLQNSSNEYIYRNCFLINKFNKFTLLMMVAVIWRCVFDLSLAVVGHAYALGGPTVGNVSLFNVYKLFYSCHVFFTFFTFLFLFEVFYIYGRECLGLRNTPDHIVCTY